MVSLVDLFVFNFSGPEGESCTAIVSEEKSLCFLISCPNNTQNSSCGNVTNFSDLFAETGVTTTANTFPLVFLHLCYICLCSFYFSSVTLPLFLEWFQNSNL